MKPPRAQSEPNFIVLHKIGENLDLLLWFYVSRDAIDDLDASRRTDAAGRALATGFDQRRIPWRNEPV